LILPVKTNKEDLSTAIEKILLFFTENKSIVSEEYAAGSYSPTPTIIEAAIALYNSHTVDEITRSDADAKNLTKTTDAITEIIDLAKRENRKIIALLPGFLVLVKLLLDLKLQHII